MSELRPVFQVTKTPRPPPDEAWLMKNHLIERAQGHPRCFWCHEEFPKINGEPDRWSISLEHITPLADGGKHELTNCALACHGCNNKNVPQSVTSLRDAAREAREARRAANRLANGGGPKHVQGTKKLKDDKPLDQVVTTFIPQIVANWGCTVITRKAARSYLKNICRMKHLQPPDDDEVTSFWHMINRVSESLRPVKKPESVLQ